MGFLPFQVDGCEPQSGCKEVLGKTDAEMAALLIAEKAVHAINLDGGGSSTTVVNGKVVSTQKLLHFVL